MYFGAAVGCTAWHGLPTYDAVPHVLHHIILAGCTVNSLPQARLVSFVDLAAADMAAVVFPPFLAGAIPARSLLQTSLQD